MKIRKIITRLQRKLIYKLDGVNSIVYMKLYNKWLKKNKLDIDGEIKYIHSSVSLDGIDYSKIHIGNNVVLSKNVIILIHDFSIEAGFEAMGLGNKENEARFIKDVAIGDNCFIGASCIVLPGAQIGKNSIVGAGTVISGKKYPENSIIVGNPAKIIGNTSEWVERKRADINLSRGKII